MTVRMRIPALPPYDEILLLAHLRVSITPCPHRKCVPSWCCGSSSEIGVCLFQEPIYLVEHSYLDISFQRKGKEYLQIVTHIPPMNYEWRLFGVHLSELKHTRVVWLCIIVRGWRVVNMPSHSVLLAVQHISSHPPVMWVDIVSKTGHVVRHLTPNLVWDLKHTVYYLAQFSIQHRSSFIYYIVRSMQFRIYYG